MSKRVRKTATRKSVAAKKKSRAGKTASAKKNPTEQKGAAGKKKTTKRKPAKRKNVSQKIPNGRTLQTRDEFFFGDTKYRKPGYEGKGLYRIVVVIDSNRKDELAVVKLTTSKKGKNLPDYQKGKSNYRPYVRTKDDENKPIKVGEKFVENRKKKDVSQKDVNTIKKDVVKIKKNRNDLKRLKGRK